MTTTQAKKPVPHINPCAVNGTTHGRVARVGSASQANDFQAAMQKKRQAQPNPTHGVKPAEHKSARDDAWKTGAPLDDQPLVLVNHRLDGQLPQRECAQADATHEDTVVRGSAARSGDGAAGCRNARLETALPTDSSLVLSLSTELHGLSGSSGEFEVLLPSGHGIGVHYAVTPALTQVLLHAQSARLSQQLKQCAAGISSALSESSGRPVAVSAV